MADIHQRFLESSSAYDNRDIDKMMSFVSEDYTWYNIGPEGAQKLADGRAQAAQGLQMVFGSPDYISGRVAFSKAFGHIVVAVEVDTYRQDGEEVEKSRLGVYEYKGDELHRAWSFPIEDSDASRQSNQ